MINLKAPPMILLGHYYSMLTYELVEKRNKAASKCQYSVYILQVIWAEYMYIVDWVSSYLVVWHQLWFSTTGQFESATHDVRKVLLNVYMRAGWTKNEAASEFIILYIFVRKQG